MFEKALNKRSLTTGKKITMHTLVSAGLIILAAVLPQLVHLALGQPGGVQLLPMYLPVLIGGCLLGVRWGLAVGVLSPLFSFAFTSLFLNEAMPAAARLPFMMAELAVFAAVSGLFSRKIADNGIWAFPAVIAAQVAGRLVFLGSAALFQGIAPFTAELVWSQILSGWLGLLIQLAAVPLVIIGLRALLLGKNND